MRKRDPRRLLRRREQARARVKIVEVPESESAPDGSVYTKQSAEVTLPREELDRLWTPEYLERLARTYWRFLTRVSLGLLRVLYTAVSREVVALGRPFVLLRFHPPEYETASDCGSVTWRIDRGVLVSPAGRGTGYLRITVRRPSAAASDGAREVTVTVDSEVANFYPAIAGRGWFSRIGRTLYQMTQLRIHVIVTHAFLRSLARLDLEASVVGALRAKSSLAGTREPVARSEAEDQARSAPGD